MSKIKTNNKIFIAILALVMVMACLSSVSAEEIGDSAVSDDSLAVGDVLSDIEQTDGDSLAVENTAGDSLAGGDVLASAGDEDALSSITPTVVISDSSHSDEINNVDKGTKVTINVQATADFAYHYDSKVASLFVNGQQKSSITLSPYNYDDNDRRGSFDYTLDDDGTYEIYVVLEAYAGYYESYNAATSNTLTYVVGSSGEDPASNDTGNASGGQSDVTVNLKIFDSQNPSNSTIYGNGDFTSDIKYELTKSDATYENEKLYIYLDGDELGSADLNSLNSVYDALQIADGSEHVLVVNYVATINGEKINVTSNSLRYVSIKQSVSPSGNFEIIDINYPSNSTIYIDSQYTVVLQYYVVVPDGYLFDNVIYFTCNGGEAIATVENPVSGIFTTVYINQVLNESGTYVFSARYKPVVLMGEQPGDFVCNSITYIVNISNSTGGDSGNSSGEGNSTGNGTGNSTAGNGTGDGNSTGNDTSNQFITIKDSATPDQIVINSDSEYDCEIEYYVNLLGVDSLTTSYIEIYCNGEYLATINDPVLNSAEKVFIKTLNETGNYVFTARYHGYVFMGSTYDFETQSSITYVINISSSGDGNGTGNGTSGNGTSTGNATGGNGTSGDGAGNTTDINSTISTDSALSLAIGEKLEVTFYDGQGNLLKNTEVIFTVNGNDYPAVTDKNGVARVNIPLSAGKYDVIITNPVTGAVKTSQITLFNRITGNKNIKMFYNDGTVYKIRVHDNNGKAVGAGQSVKISVGKRVYYVKTDSKGYASLVIKNTPSKYVVTASYGGVSVSNTLVVKSAFKYKTQKIKKSKKTNKIKISIKANKKSALKDKKIILKFKGKKYKAKTNKKGVATFKIPKKVVKKLKIGKKYKAVFKYGSTSKTKKIKVKR